MKVISEALEGIRIYEKQDPVILDSEAPCAYLFLTNNSFWYDLQGTGFKFAARLHGFKIPTLFTDYKVTLAEGLKLREEHKELFEVIDAFRTHNEIPSTFDGEIPEFAFDESGNHVPRLLIGQKEVFSDGQKEVSGTLKEAVVDENDKLAICMYQMEGGGIRIVKVPLTDIELAAYKSNPDTFFGRVKKAKSGIESPFDFFDMVSETYKNTPKEKLLEFLKNHPDLEKLKELPQEELAIIYAEKTTNSFIDMHYQDFA